jgi:hypothetical protein
MVQYRDFGMREYLDRLAAEDERDHDSKLVTEPVDCGEPDL